MHSEKSASEKAKSKQQSRVQSASINKVQPITKQDEAIPTHYDDQDIEQQNKILY